jgi:archaellum component FlaC
MKKEEETMEHDMEFLEKIDDKFDPLESYFEGKTKESKRFRYE